MPRRVRGKKSRKRHFIKEWREFRGMTQDELAERIGMTAATLSRIENLKLPYNQDTLELISDALNVPVGSLISRDPNDPDQIWGVWDQVVELSRRFQKLGE